MRTSLAAGLLALVLSAAVLAQTTPGASSSTPPPAPSPTHAPLLQGVTVTGVQPGPGLWKVSKGDHVMWVLGTLKPLPKRMQWHSAEVEDVLSHSQELIETPRASLKVDAGFFTKLVLLPSVYSARKNPGGASLQQILPPQIYARWEAVKPQYFGKDRSVEYWRPILVALKLYQKALEKAGLTNTNDISKAILKMADQHGIKRTPVRYRVVIEHPRDALDMIKQTNLHDISCFNQTLDIVQKDMGVLAERANAWSVGDVEALRGYSVNDRYESCLIAVINADFAQQLGIQDLPQRLEQEWMQAAEAALARNAQTFAVLPMHELLSPDGYLAHLKARGYTVEAPDEQSP